MKWTISIDERLDEQHVASFEPIVNVSRPCSPIESETHSQVCVRTGARLHFGLLSNRPQSGREFGGIGLMVDQPGWTIRMRAGVADAQAPNAIRLSKSVDALNPESVARVQSFAARYLSDASARDEASQQQVASARIKRNAERTPLEIDIATAIPGHQGLGSGTQLGLAIAKGLAVLEGRDASSDELARRIGRGRRSAVGIWGFDFGGLLVDGGKRPADDIGVMVARFDVPAEWRFVLVSPRTQQGLSGAAELAAFSQLPPMGDALTQRLSQIILTSVLPALRQRAFDEFSAALFEYGRLVGEYFAPAQGGIFAAAMMPFLGRTLSNQGHAQPVQTSWGPTCAIPCHSDTEASEVLALVRQEVRDADLQTQVVRALNAGASVSCEILDQ